MVNSKCWAAVLGGCHGGISREHVVSKAIFTSPGVTVQGFHWCKHEPKTVGIEAITSKVLCKKHNSDLTSLDEAAGAAFDCLRRQTKLYNDRQKFSSRAIFAVERFVINAILLERWLLKTLINLTWESNFFVGVDGDVKGTPSASLVNICYGLQPFPYKSGMYVAANIGMELDMKETVSFSPLIKDGERILGGFFEFRGIRLFFCLEPQGFNYAFCSLPNISPDWAHANLLRPFKQIKVKRGKRLSHTIDFCW